MSGGAVLERPRAAGGRTVTDLLTSPSAPFTIDDITRREFVTAALATLFLSACGSDDDDDATPSANANATFPVTVTHKYGDTTISAPPQRVVVVGPTDEDPLLALGIVPVGMMDWWGNFEVGDFWPWAQPLLAAATPTIIPLDGEPHFEEITALNPDLIIGQYCGMTSEEYTRFSQIAPTVAQSGEYPDWQTPWQVMTQNIAQALGRVGQGDQLIAGVEDAFARARQAHPTFSDRSVLYVERGVGTFTVRGANEPRVKILTNMGLTVPEAYANPGPFGVDFSDERMSLLDEVDVVFWVTDAAGRDELLTNPLFQGLRVTQEQRHVFVIDETLSAAINWSSVLSLPYAVDQIAPLIAAVL